MCQVAVAGSSLLLDLKATCSQRSGVGREASKRASSLETECWGFPDEQGAATAVLQMDGDGAGHSNLAFIFLGKKNNNSPLPLFLSAYSFAVLRGFCEV